jgi:hypothetical protein
MSATLKGKYIKVVRLIYNLTTLMLAIADGVFGLVLWGERAPQM